VSRAAICLTFALACSSKSEPPRPEPAQEATRNDGSAGGDRTSEAAGDVTSGARGEREPGPPGRQTARAGRPIDIVLRSSPPGATAAVDGVPIGPTPTYWAGEANGREHEFTFVMPGYAFARYRFVPITSGVVHARLEVLAEDTDAGVLDEMMRMLPEPLSPADAQRPRAPQVPPDTPPSEVGPVAPDPARAAGPQP